MNGIYNFVKLQWALGRVNEHFVQIQLDIGRITQEQYEDILNTERKEQ